MWDELKVCYWRLRLGLVSSQLQALWATVAMVQLWQWVVISRLLYSSYVYNVHICQKLYFYLGQIWIKNIYFIDFGFIFWRLAMLIVNLVCQFGAQQWLSSWPHSDPHRNNSRIWQSSGDLIFWVNSRPVTPLSNNFPCFVMVTLPENLDWVET